MCYTELIAATGISFFLISGVFHTRGVSKAELRIGSALIVVRMACESSRGVKQMNGGTELSTKRRLLAIHLHIIDAVPAKKWKIEAPAATAADELLAEMLEQQILAGGLTIRSKSPSCTARQADLRGTRLQNPHPFPAMRPCALFT